MTILEFLLLEKNIQYSSQFFVGHLFCCSQFNTLLNEDVASKVLLAMMLIPGSSKIILLCSRDCFSMLPPLSKAIFKFLLPPHCCPHCTDHHQSCHGLTACSGFKKQTFHQEGYYSHTVCCCCFSH